MLSRAERTLAGELAQEQRGTTDAHLAGNHAALEQL